MKTKKRISHTPTSICIFKKIIKNEFNNELKLSHKKMYQLFTQTAQADLRRAKPKGPVLFVRRYQFLHDTMGTPKIVDK